MKYGNEGTDGEFGCHIRPQDETAPPPTVEIRGRDLVAFRGYVLGMEAQDQALLDGLTKIEAYMAGWLLTAKYFKTHNRRRTALDDIL